MLTIATYDIAIHYFSDCTNGKNGDSWDQKKEMTQLITTEKVFELTIKIGLQERTR